MDRWDHWTDGTDGTMGPMGPSPLTARTSTFVTPDSILVPLVSNLVPSESILVAVELAQVSPEPVQVEAILGGTRDDSGTTRVDPRVATRI